jgi:AcrR family transcriptional regulator
MSRLVMAVQRMKRDKRTSERILDIAERLVQTRGFNSFSYGDIAKELGITTASLHYHFRGKAELGQALITRYTERFREALDRIDQEVPEPSAKLEAYADLYAGVLEGKRMCMCGVLAAEYQTLAQADAPRGARLLRRESALAGQCAQAGNDGQDAGLHRITGRGRPKDPLDARRRDARGSPIRRPGQVQCHRPPAAGQPRELTRSPRRRLIRLGAQSCAD